MCYRLSGLQIAMGILSLIFAIVLYGMEHSDDQGADVITYISHGIWMGFIVRHYYGYVQYRYSIKSLSLWHVYIASPPQHCSFLNYEMKYAVKII